MIASDWMLVTAGTQDAYNTMTASWGALGELWNRKIAICYVRPVRHTFGFMEKHEYFTLCWFNEIHREILKFCGTNSGRDVDKEKRTGLVPVESPSGSVYFDQARLVLECKKIYTHDLDPALFLDPMIEKEYPEKDYHRVYLGEITACLRK